MEKRESPFLGIDHIGIVVRDLSAAVETYRDILGFDVGGGETLEDRGLDVRFLPVGDTRLELIAPTREDSQISKALSSRGEGLHHICVRVDDIDRALADLRARGARVIDDAPRPGAHGSRVAFLHPKGSHGVLLELVEYPAT